MFEATQAAFADADIVVLSAAVADYTPAHPARSEDKEKRNFLFAGADQNDRHCRYAGRSETAGAVD